MAVKTGLRMAHILERTVRRSEEKERTAADNSFFAEARQQCRTEQNVSVGGVGGGRQTLSRGRAARSTPGVVTVAHKIRPATTPAASQRLTSDAIDGSH